MDILDPDDKRALFQRIVDDIKTQIDQHRLQPNSPLPSARQLAQIYGVASMTAQRALRELQHLRLTYGVAGKGTFVHPDAFDRLRARTMNQPVGDDNPDLRRRVADYLATQHDLYARYQATRSTTRQNAIISELLELANTHRDLVDEMARYQTEHGNPAQEPLEERRRQAQTGKPSDPPLVTVWQVPPGPRTTTRGRRKTRPGNGQTG